MSARDNAQPLDPYCLHHGTMPLLLPLLVAELAEDKATGKTARLAAIHFSARAALAEPAA